MININNISNMLYGYINCLILISNYPPLHWMYRNETINGTIHKKLHLLYNLHWNLCRKPCRCHMPTNIRRSEYISYGKIKTRRYIECIERRLNVEKFVLQQGYKITDVYMQLIVLPKLAKISISYTGLAWPTSSSKQTMFTEYYSFIDRLTLP